MVTLLSEETQWLDRYRESLHARYPGLVERMILFGSKARGDAHEDSDLDLFIVIREGDWRLKMELADLASELALGTDTVPSLVILTTDEWQTQQNNDSVFLETVQKDGVQISP